METPQVRQALADLKGKVGTMGPWGGSGGKSWSTLVGVRVTGIRIKYGDVIDSLQFQLKTDDEEPVWTNRFGGEGGLHSNEILFAGDEELIFVMGTGGTYVGLNVVGQLTFLTNKETHGPFGGGGGPTFCMTNGTSDKVVGFHGSSGDVVDKIGVYFTPN